MSFALYRKYRPQNFDELMGQSAVRRTLMEALKQGRLVHAYLFSGPRGIGKPLPLGSLPRPFSVSPAKKPANLVAAVPLVNSMEKMSSLT